MGREEVWSGPRREYVGCLRSGRTRVEGSLPEDEELLVDQLLTGQTERRAL